MWNKEYKTVLNTKANEVKIQIAYEGIAVYNMSKHCMVS